MSSLGTIIVTVCRSEVVPGFSDDGESGEDLPEDLVVMGKGIKQLPRDVPSVDIPLEL